ncbi:MAG: apolipoprotein N-acyltransferase [Betaproteobacteria bacterium]|nr:apolipoprotein N-acyltransferase [Betaproteobacteria bacterium]
MAFLAQLLERAPRRSDAFWLGFSFGLGYFGAGICWIYIALHDYGGMPWILATGALLLFAGYLSVFPALGCWIGAHFGGAVWPLVFASGWTLSEWLRGWLFTGFPWLALGYSQIPHSPLAGFVPLLGVYGATFATTFVGASLPRILKGPGRVSSLVAVVLVAGTGPLVGAIPWTAVDGQPVRVALVQGNIHQDIKFRDDVLIRTLVEYAQAVEQTDAKLVVLPETALPLFVHEIPGEYVERLRRHVTSRGGDLVTGVFENDPQGSDRYFNSVISLGTSPRQTYRKHHLVPFGEFVPLKSVLGPVIHDWLHIPLSDQTRGASHQQPLLVAGLRVAVNICYEDVFGEEIIRQLPRANALANVTNDAWYGHSWAADQHLQISQARALETGRWMLRATNTGVTAAIDAKGFVLDALPQFQKGVLSLPVQGRSGVTPYVRLSNWPIILGSSFIVMVWLIHERHGRRRREREQSRSW